MSPSNVPGVELIGVFEPMHKPLSEMTDEEVEEMASEMYDHFVEKLTTSNE